MNLENLNQTLKDQPKYRYQQINQALFQDFISSWDEVSSLPKALREKLARECPLDINAEVSQTKGSDKALITFDGGTVVETVLIRQKGERQTVCVSTQAGCPLGCAFCATGAAGFERNLTAAEIVAQVIFWERVLKAEGRGGKVDNVVFMGMGEPFLNYPEFIKAAKFLNDPEKLNIGARRLSVSTSGITEGIKRLAGEKLQINLAISLHAADDNLRRELMPIAKKYSLREIFQAADAYIAKTGRRVMIEYLMLKGINDGADDALALAKLAAQPLYMVNLIPYNPTGRFQPSPRERIAEFQKTLEDNGIAVTVRLSFGAEIGAACGQLKGKGRSAKKILK